MSYKSNIVVARFTEAEAEKFKSVNPGATAMHMPPFIGTRADARKEVTKIANQSIADSEKVVGIRLKDETDAGWMFSITVDDKYPRR
jgi:hypothetical protein